MGDLMVATAGADDEGEGSMVAERNKGGRKPGDATARAGGALTGTIVVRSTDDVMRGVRACNKVLKGFTRSDTIRTMLIAAAKATAEDPAFLAKGVIAS